MPSVGTNRGIAILLPVFDDAKSFAWVVRELDAALAVFETDVTVVVVDDGSFQALAFDAGEWQAKCIREVRCVRLRGNVGHQSAIAIGLSYVHQNVSCDAVLVMDADGEDKPEDAARLVERFRESDGSSLIFAERIKRSEGVVFLVFYTLYRILVRIFTGRGARVGNFSILPVSQLERLVVSPYLWSHYAATTFVARVPSETIPTKRGMRHDGRSSMNFVALVVHGLTAISVYGAIVGVRLTYMCVLASALAITSWAGLFAYRFAIGETSLDILLLAAGLTALFVSQMLLASFAFMFFILDNRTKLNFVPVRDYELFIDCVRKLYPAGE